MSIKIGVFAGSFDPITNGHLRVLDDSLKIFDKVILLVAFNPNKKGLFTQEERIEIIQNVLPDNYKGSVDIDILPENIATSEYSQKLGATHLIRGIRSATDLDYEFQLNLVNKTISPSIETVYFLTPRELIEVSSSMVKGLMGINGWESVARNYVHPFVVQSMQNKMSAK